MDEKEAYKMEEARQISNMWKGVADYYACDGTCDFCMKYHRRGKRLSKGG